MGRIAPDRFISDQLILYHDLMSKSSDLVLGETKGNVGLGGLGNVIKLRYILSGVSSRVIMGQQEEGYLGCYEKQCVVRYIVMKT
jgi:hypothetical protein